MANLATMNISLDENFHLNDESFESTDVVLTPKSDRTILTPKSDRGKQKRKFEKRYQCTHCLKTYTKRSYYQKHVLEHSSQKNLRNCSLCNLTFLNDKDLRSHKAEVHTSKKEQTVYISELPAIDDFAIFKKKSNEPDYYDFVQAKIPLSPCTDDCSNFSTGSTLSTTSSSSSFNRANTFLASHMNGDIASTTDDSSRDTNFSLATDYYEEMRDVDEEILMILKNQLEKNFVDVMLSFSEY